MVEITLNEKEIKMQALRAQAKQIEEYIHNITAHCAYINCYECPMNVSVDNILCISNIKVIR